MDAQKRKLRLTQHQRQVRFLGGLFLVVMILATILLFWLVNRPDFTAR
jgi:cobalamin biosynthesis protein CobD/CbiB